MQGPRKVMSTFCGRGAAGERGQGGAERQGCKDGGKGVARRRDCDDLDDDDDDDDDDGDDAGGGDDADGGEHAARNIAHCCALSGSLLLAIAQTLQITEH
eukprot:7270343-Pyramimonas_sp.AAC.3